MPPKSSVLREMLAVCPPGLEAVVARELEDIGWKDARSIKGGILIQGDLELVWRTCLWSRTASGLRVRVGGAAASNLEELACGIRSLPWSHFLEPGQDPRVLVTAHESRLHHRDTLANKVVLAIRDALRGPSLPRLRRWGPENTPPLVHMLLEKDRALLSVDAAGEPLYHRGWRSQGGAAPIRENLAASVLQSAGWTPGMPLVDAFTGSGTFIVEAAGMAEGRAPGANRSFDFERWPIHDPVRYKRLARSVEVGEKTVLAGWDADEGAIALAQANARKAGIHIPIRWVCAKVVALDPEETPGLVVANPPYGLRLGRSVAGVYRDFGESLRERFPGWRVAMLCPERRLVQATGLAFKHILTFPHGGLKVGLWGVDL